MGELRNLVNIGPALEQQLEAVGITTYEQLKEAGSKTAWRNIKAMDPSA